MEPALKASIDIASMADVAREMLWSNITVFVDGDHAKSVEIIARDRSVDNMKKQIECDLTSLMMENPKSISRALKHLTIAQAIERIADHATNIAEEVFYFYNAQDIRHEPSIKGMPPAAGLSKQSDGSGAG